MTKESNNGKIAKLIIGFTLCFGFSENVFFDNISGVLAPVHKLGKNKKDKKGKVDRDKVECDRLPTEEVREGLMANNKISWLEGGLYASGSMVGGILFWPISGSVYPDYGFNEQGLRRRVIVDRKNS